MVFQAWEENMISNFSKQIESSIQLKINQAKTFNDLQQSLHVSKYNICVQFGLTCKFITNDVIVIFYFKKKNAWDLTQKITERALTQAICTISWNTNNR